MIVHETTKHLRVFWILLIPLFAAGAISARTVKVKDGYFKHGKIDVPVFAGVQSITSVSRKEVVMYSYTLTHKGLLSTADEKLREIARFYVTAKGSLTLKSDLRVSIRNAGGSNVPAGGEMEHFVSVEENNPAQNKPVLNEIYIGYFSDENGMEFQDVPENTQIIKIDIVFNR